MRRPLQTVRGDADRVHCTPNFKHTTMSASRSARAWLLAAAMLLVLLGGADSSSSGGGSGKAGAFKFNYTQLDARNKDCLPSLRVSSATACKAAARALGVPWDNKYPDGFARHTPRDAASDCFRSTNGMAYFNPPSPTTSKLGKDVATIMPSYSICYGTGDAHQAPLYI